tara:strand:- start:131 stop:499 length:369 start_codon:yes stop_codon:yes gene_type:complete
MASFAKIGSNNKVIEVLSVVNEVLHDSDGVEQESIGINFLNATYRVDNVNWKQTSYNNNFRKNHASVGGTYDEDRDAFIAPKPYASWVLNETTCRWESPVDLPDTENRYTWNEDTTSWDLIE